MDQQLPLPMLTHYSGPKLVSPAVIANIRTYREACRTAMAMSPRKHLTYRVLAEETGTYASHVSEYFSEDVSKRELPAKYINEVEISLGNRVISQWLASQAQLTVLEQFIGEHRLVA